MKPDDKQGKHEPLILHVTNHPIFLWWFMAGQVQFMKNRGVKIGAVSSDDPILLKFADREGVDVHKIRIKRSIAPFSDLVAIFQLAALFRRLKPDTVVLHHVKAGLVGSIAARLAGVPRCIYFNHGMAVFSSAGIRRTLLKASEIIACSLSHRVLCASHSVLERAVELGIVSSQRISVPHNGSTNAVDAERIFNPSLIPAGARQSLRRQFNIPDDAWVMGYVGRVRRPKGLVELFECWQMLREKHPQLHFLIVGPFDPEDPVPQHIQEALRQDPRVHLAGYVEQPAALYTVLDVFVFPSHYEGLATVLLEASAMQIPIITTNVPGCLDVVRQGVTGVRVERGDVKGIASAIEAYMADPSLARAHGAAGREFVKERYRPQDFWSALLDIYVAQAPASDGVHACARH